MADLPKTFQNHEFSIETKINSVVKYAGQCIKLNLPHSIPRTVMMLVYNHITKYSITAPWKHNQTQLGMPKSFPSPHTWGTMAPSLLRAGEEPKPRRDAARERRWRRSGAAERGRARRLVWSKGGETFRCCQFFYFFLFQHHCHHSAYRPCCSQT